MGSASGKDVQPGDPDAQRPRKRRSDANDDDEDGDLYDDQPLPESRAQPRSPHAPAAAAAASAPVPRLALPAKQSAAAAVPALSFASVPLSNAAPYSPLAASDPQLAPPPFATRKAEPGAAQLQSQSQERKAARSGADSARAPLSPRSLQALQMQNVTVVGAKHNSHCIFYKAGSCRWGEACRFVHKGVGSPLYDGASPDSGLLSGRDGRHSPYTRVEWSEERQAMDALLSPRYTDSRPALRSHKAQ